MAAGSRLLATCLLNLCWQLGLLAAAALVCCRLLRRAPARLRHRLLVAALVLGALLPLASVPLPAGRLAARTLWLPGGPAGAGEVGGLLGLLAALRGRAERLVVAPAVAPGLAAAYALFVLHRLWQLGRAWRRTVALRRSAEARPLPERLAAVRARCARALGVGPVPVLPSAAAAGPLTLGARRPVVLLPEALFTTGEEDVLVSALGHELAHVGRGDYAWNLLHEALLLPLSFHPCARWLKRRLDLAREEACDELVSERLIEPRRYARALVQMAGAHRAPGRTYSMAALDPPALEVRVMRLIEPRPALSPSRGRLLLAANLLLLGTAGTAAVVGACTPAQEPRGPAPARAPAPGATPAPAAEDDTEAPGFVASRERTSGELPHLPEAVKRRLVGQTVDGTYKVCVDTAGRVSGVEVVTGIAEADQAIMATLLGWTFRPPAAALCYLDTMRFIIE